MTDAIVTRVAHTGADELRFHGRRVFAQLLGRASVGQMLVLGLSGRMLDADEIAIIDDIITAMSSADPRLWPFKVTRLASAHGVGAYGVAATLIAGEGGMYGSNRLLDTVKWLQEVERQAGGERLSDDAMAQLLERGAGFGVLYRARDERFEALIRQVITRGRHELPFWTLCMQAARVARERKQIEAHVYLAIAALCLDLKLPAHSIAAFANVLLFHDALANATEGAEQAPVILRELPSETIDYRGVAPRRSPRAEASSKVV